MVEILKSRSYLLDSIPVALLLTDVHSKILFASRQTASIFGYEKKEIEGQRIRALFLEEDLIYFLPNIIYLTLYKEGFAGEALLRQKDGSKIFVFISTTSFKENGEVFLAFTFQEIQRLKNLERRRLEVERWVSLGRMVEEIAHQIRNPIVSIGGYTKRLLKSFSSSQKSQSYLGQIFRETKRLETIIHRVEEYIRIPRPTYRKEKIQEVVESTLQTISEEAMEKEISIHFETGSLEGDRYLFMDRNLVTKTLSHILKNGIEALMLRPVSKKKMPLKITLFEEGENIGISIADKGQGISKRNLDLIFEPFFSTWPDRVGLGLTFVKRVMEEHGGKIRVESGLRKGTTITLFFPKDRRRKIRRELISSEATLRD